MFCFVVIHLFIFDLHRQPAVEYEMGFYCYFHQIVIKMSNEMEQYSSWICVTADLIVEYILYSLRIDLNFKKVCILHVKMPQALEKTEKCISL